MLPLFGDAPGARKHKRPINLGGTSSTSSQSAILDSAKARREERAIQKKRQEGATTIQAHWRSHRKRLELRNQVKKQLVAVQGHEAGASDDELLWTLRAAVLIGDDDILATWAQLAKPNHLIQLLGGNYPSFKVLLQKYCHLCLTSVARNPNSINASQLLNLVLKMVAYSQDMAQYLLSRSLYTHIATIIGAIPVSAAKTSSLLPPLISIAVQPLSLPACHEVALLEALKSILTLPLLPNRLPIPSLTMLSAKLPLQLLHSVEIPLLHHLESRHIDSAQHAHLISNLSTFASPRYLKLPDPAKCAYLHICTALMNSLAVGSLEPPPSKDSLSNGVSIVDSEDDEDSPAIRVQVVQSFDAPKPPSLDPKTYKRLAGLFTSTSLGQLLHGSNKDLTRRALYSYLTALLGICASNAKRESTIAVVLASGGQGLIREIWRSCVRSSSLGKEMYSATHAEHRSNLPPTILLCELYSQSLLTMGDDEFFGNTGVVAGGTKHTLGTATSTSGKLPSGSAGPSRARNPLSIDDIRTLTKQLLNVVWELYLRDDIAHGGPSNASSKPPVSNAMDVDRASTIIAEVECRLRLSWEQIREEIGKLLVAVWARDSRKQFLPETHWHVPLSQADVRAFTEAALAEDENMSMNSAPEGDYRGRDPRAVMSKRQLAMLAPRLGVLNNVPFALPFEVRVDIFRNFIVADKFRLGNDRYTYEGRRRMTRAVVRRGRVSEDGFNKLGDADLKAPIEITFIDQFGNEEAGIDGGGVFKEFFTELCKEVFHTDRGLWLATKNNELYPNPIGFATESHSLNWYRFIGRILGKAMYEGILVDVAFAGFFLAKWLGRASFLDDLASLDSELYNGLIFLKHYEGDFEDLSLNFTIANEELGITKTVDLIRNGSNIPVTQENKLQYIHLVSHYRLTKQIKRQCDAFFDGLSEIIDPKWLRMFNQQEVQILIGGVNAPIDVDDLRNHTVYGGLYDANHETIIAFWNVVAGFDQEKRRQLLRFVTSCSRPPLLGFKELQPSFAIRDAGSHEDRLPTSSTCVNLLKLPRYTSERLLRAKLSQAIAAGAGFDLS